jgi:hypothetical protein
LEDLKKAQHFLQKYIEVAENYGEPKMPTGLPIVPDWVQYIKPDGWVGFTFEGADAEGFHFRCKRCRLRLLPIDQYEPPWNYHDAAKCEEFKGSSQPPGEQSPPV